MINQGRDNQALHYIPAQHSTVDIAVGLSLVDRALKRSFDLLLSTSGLLLFGWLILLTYLVATIDTRQNGLFMQTRIGRYGKRFRVMKIRTMRNLAHIQTTVTTQNDPRITLIGHFLRRTKLDELPQLINVLVGQMSFVGPRPDVPGFADHLEGEDRIVLSVRPGITGPASLVYRNEEQLLAAQYDPELFNRTVLFPEKVRVNRDYVRNYRFSKDIEYIFRTVLGR